MHSFVTPYGVSHGTSHGSTHMHCAAAGLLCELAESAADLSPELQHLAAQLARLRGALVQAQHEGAATNQDIQHYQALLDILGTKRVNGVFGGGGGGEPPAGHAVVAALFEQCSQLLEGLRGSAVQMSAPVGGQFGGSVVGGLCVFRCGTLCSHSGRYKYASQQHWCSR